MSSWPDTPCERPVSGGRLVVHYDLGDSGESFGEDAMVDRPAQIRFGRRDTDALDAERVATLLGPVLARLEQLVSEHPEWEGKVVWGS